MEKKLLICKRLDFKGLNAFWKDVNKHFEDGWRYIAPEKRGDMPAVRHMVKVTLVKGSDDGSKDLSLQDDRNIKPNEEDDGKISEEENKSEKKKAKDEADLDSLSKKKDLLGYADNEGIEVPEDIKQPAAIKKFIKEKLSE